MAIASIDASASSMPVALGSSAILSASILPAESGVAINFIVDSGIGTLVQYSATTNGLGVATTLPITSLGVNLYKITAIAGSNCAISTAAYLPVYDPNGSFITGGGWIMSPVGAIPNTTLSGKANFGFNAKYKKGNNQVEGNTEFQFKAGDLNFKSTLHESGSLVISGKKATYRGDGTINGVGGFKFTLVAIDGDWNNGVAPDQFRIKITTTTGTVVYDNGLGANDNSDVSTVLGGGSIVIHEVKTKGNSKVVDSPKSVVLGLFDAIVYPNPSNDQFTLKIEGGSSEKVQVQVFDLLGRSVIRTEKTNGETIQFGKDLPGGSYITVINQGIETKTVRLIK
jgi:hypothetical protein